MPKPSPKLRSLLLGGRRHGEWLETSDGAWGSEPELRYDHSAVR